MERWGKGSTYVYTWGTQVQLEDLMPSNDSVWEWRGECCCCWAYSGQWIRFCNLIESDCTASWDGEYTLSLRDGYFRWRSLFKVLHDIAKLSRATIFCSSPENFSCILRKTLLTTNIDSQNRNKLWCRDKQLMVWELVHTWCCSVSVFGSHSGTKRTRLITVVVMGQISWCGLCS